MRRPLEGEVKSVPDHNPIKFAAGLSTKLATRSRHVCVFLGAGSSRACGLPDVTALQNEVLAELGQADRALFNRQLIDRNFEQTLSRLRRIAALLTGVDQLDGLTASSAAELDRKACQAIIKRLDISAANLKPAQKFSAWVARANYHLPVEVFTVNYDLLLETAFEQMRLPYFDGFLGTLRAQFQTELIEASPQADRNCMPAFFARLWKLHGSVNWVWDNQQVVRLGQPLDKGATAAIYPSDTKYEESRRVPFVVLQDRFRRALYTPETLTLVSGYSFGDAHLNEMLFDAASRRERSEIVVFCYEQIPVTLAERALTTPNLQVVSPGEAILGGVRGAWKAPEDVPPNLWANDRFILGDFAQLAAFLARTSSPDRDVDALLVKLLEAAAAGESPANKQDG